MDERTKVLVRARAEGRYEYCQILQSLYPDFVFHVEHVVARQHGGVDLPSNLALACHLCNGKKGPNLSGIDPLTGDLSRLFHPRSDDWDSHFLIESSGLIVGQTAVGRTTITVLNMNSEIRIAIRAIALGQ